MNDHSEETGHTQDTPCEHCGIFTLGGDIPIQGAWRDITYVPVRDNIWSVSEGIYRTIFLKGQKGVVAFDTLTTPGTARAYAAAVGRVYPNNPIHTTPITAWVLVTNSTIRSMWKALMDSF